MDIQNTNKLNTDIRCFINTFFTHFFIEKNVNKVVSMVSDHICFFLSSEICSGHNKFNFKDMLSLEFKNSPATLSFDFTNYYEHKLSESNLFNVFCTIERYVSDDIQSDCKVSSYITITITNINGTYVISSLHISDMENRSVVNNYLGLSFAPNTTHHLNRKSSHELMKVLSGILPVGIIGVFLDDDLSLFVVNDKMLEIVDYTYQEYLEDTNGLFGSTIHPDDISVIETILQTLKHSNQYEAEYRIRKKDGSYIWIYDVGRKIITDDGREAIICGIIDITKRVELGNKLYNETLTDSLTNAYNRKGAKILLNQKLENIRSYTFLIMDIDHFKAVNDIYGHYVGDQILSFISKVLIRTFRESDIIIRLGGDEFAIFLESCSNRKIIEKKLENISEQYQNKVAECCPLSNSTLSFGGIISKTKYSFEELYSQADKILYEVKYNSKGSYKLKDI